MSCLFHGHSSGLLLAYFIRTFISSQSNSLSMTLHGKGIGQLIQNVNWTLETSLLFGRLTAKKLESWKWKNLINGISVTWKIIMKVRIFKVRRHCVQCWFCWFIAGSCALSPQGFGGALKLQVPSSMSDEVAYKQNILQKVTYFLVLTSSSCGIVDLDLCFFNCM